MKNAFTLFISLVLLLWSNISIAEVDLLSHRSLENQAKRHLEFTASFLTSYAFLSRNAPRLGISYQFDFIRFETSARFESGPYSSYAVLPNSGESTDGFNSVSVENSEIFRERDATDPWSSMYIDLAVGIKGRAFLGFMPFISQRARVGLGYFKASDSVNRLSFTGFIPNVEAAVCAVIGSSRRFNIEYGFNYVGGGLQSSAISGQPGRLPVSLLSQFLGIGIFF